MLTKMGYIDGIHVTIYMYIYMYMITKMGYIDGIHEAPYMAAPYGSVMGFRPR